MSLFNSWLTLNSSYDVTDKLAPKILSRTSYDGASYTHQGWVLDKQWQEWLLLDDEYDEVNEAGPAEDGSKYSQAISTRAKSTNTS